MKSYLKPILSIFIGLMLMLVSISFATTAVLYCRPLYYLNINRFVGKNNLDFQQIKENYDTLIDYNSFWGHEKLEFPYLPSSANGITHFEEVKTIFLEFQIILIIGLITSIFLILIYRKFYKTCEYLLIGGLATIFVPFTLAVFIYANFDRVFVTFHQIVFNNDYWIFDYKTDPIINFLPQEFFMLSAICIVGIVFLSGIIMLVLYRLRARKSKLINL